MELRKLRKKFFIILDVLNRKLHTSRRSVREEDFKNRMAIVCRSLRLGNL